MRNDETEIEAAFTDLDLANYLIVSAPLASSGDIYHVAAVLILLKLFELENCKGIVGNTSGTLDIAAFVGHKVFNIHHMDPEKPIDYQDYRLFMQMVFLTIQLRYEWDRYENKTAANQENNLLTNLLEWMKTGERPHLPKKSLPSETSLTYFSQIKSGAGKPRELSFWRNLKAETDKNILSLIVRSSL